MHPIINELEVSVKKIIDFVQPTCALAFILPLM